MNRPLHYILIGHKAVPANLMTWARWFQATSSLKERHVADTTIGATRISTVFLGLDHSYSKNGPPLLFETMTFGGPLDDTIQTRCSTWEQAEAQHREACDRVRGYAVDVPPGPVVAKKSHMETKPE